MKRLMKEHHNHLEDILRQLGEYNDKLEQLVSIRTAELDDEKRKTEQLLGKMLPP